MKTININIPIPTPFGNIASIRNDWKNVESISSDFVIAKIVSNSNQGEIFEIPIKIIPEDSTVDVAFKFPPLGKEFIFLIKISIFKHLQKCDLCLKYIMVHELTHAVRRFIFPYPWELIGFGKEVMYMAHHYFTDAIIDWWNIKNKNYGENDPIKSIGHRYMKSKVHFEIKNREDLFEYLLFFIRLASHNTVIRNNLCNFMDKLPNRLYDEYAKLYEIMVNLDVSKNWSIFPIYQLIKNAAELTLCKNKKDVMTREIKRRIYTLQHVGKQWLKMEEMDKKKSLNKICNKDFIHPIQIIYAARGWRNAIKQINTYGNKDFKEIDDFLRGITSNKHFRKTFLIEYRNDFQ